MKSKLITSLAASAGLLITCGSASAATTFLATETNAKSVANNGFISAGAADLRVGAGGNSGVQFKSFAVFSVQNILTETGLAQGDLATTNFTISFNTTNNLAINGSAGTYLVSYIGFTANNALANQFWLDQLVAYNGASTKIDTGVADTVANQTGITSPTFNLAGITESDTANDYVIFGIGYSNQGAASGPSNREQLGDITLIGPDPIPEPSSAALLGLGGLALLLRRRK